MQSPPPAPTPATARWGCRFALVLCTLLAGCAPHARLPEQAPADLVRITTMAGYPMLSRRDIRQKERVDALVAFVNSLPGRWGIPWYGPPVGRVYFEFISAKRGVGNFYVGPDFFGRDTDRHYSQEASRARIEELGKIVDIDLWGYINSTGPGGPPTPPGATPASPTAAPAKPTAAPAKPAAAQVKPTAAPSRPAAQPTGNPQGGPTAPPT
ncbi:MAG: hypothetical protein ABSH26_12550 [Opitutaceae bacterium]|jgi:hypothetical protein